MLKFGTPWVLTFDWKHSDPELRAKVELLISSGAVLSGRCSDLRQLLGGSDAAGSIRTIPARSSGTSQVDEVESEARKLAQ